LVSTDVFIRIKSELIILWNFAAPQRPEQHHIGNLPHD